MWGGQIDFFLFHFGLTPSFFYSLKSIPISKGCTIYLIHLTANTVIICLSHLFFNNTFKRACFAISPLFHRNPLTSAALYSLFIPSRAPQRRRVFRIYFSLAFSVCILPVLHYPFMLCLSMFFLFTLYLYSAYLCFTYLCSFYLHFHLYILFFLLTYL